MKPIKPGATNLPVSIGILLFVSILAFPINLSGQSSGTIKGTIKSAKNDNPLQYVNILLQKANEDGKLQGTTSNAKGRFIIEDIEWGTYQLALSYVGFQNKTIKDLTLNPESPTIELDSLTMQESSTNLDAVTVEEERDFLTQTPEGITVNPSKNITQTGGSAIDILENTPTVNVTFDGGITMRGTEAGATQVLINGRESALSNNVDQIPASAIESIEVIHNPGAKYRAEGKGGVINIILKKPTKEGTNGKVQLSAGRENRYNTALELNHGTENFNHFLNFNRSYDVGLGNGSSSRKVFNDESPDINYLQDGTEEDYETNNTIRGGTQYFWNYFNELGLDILYENNREDNLETRENKIREEGEGLASPNLLQHRNQITETTEEGYSIEPTLYYNRDFAEPDKSLKVSVKYSYSFEEEDQLTEKRPLLTQNNNGFAIRENNQLTEETRELGIFRADYTDPVFDSGKIEAGIRSQYRTLNNDYDYSLFNRQKAEWENLNEVSNEFIYKEQVHAGYFQYSHEYKNWTFMGGIRAEQTMIDIDVANVDSQGNKEYLNFFPSGRIQYQFNKKHTLTLSYTKRIDRPSAWRLNPFPDLTDSLSIFVGNPNIDPEYIHAFELTHNKQWEDFSLNTTAFYRKRNGVVDYLTQIRGGIPYIRPQNLASGTTYGLEMNSVIQLTDFWRLNLNGSVYNSRIRGEIDENVFSGAEGEGQSLDNEAITWYAKMNTTIELPWSFKFQLTGNYYGPEVEALEKREPIYYFNAGLQKPILDGKASIGVNVRDVFDTREFKEIGETDNFREERINERQAQVFMVSFDYDF